MSRIQTLLCLSALVGLCIVACKNPYPFEPLPEREYTYLHILNAYDGIGSIDVRMTSFEETKDVADGLAFLDAWPTNGYASLLTYTSFDQTDSSAQVIMEVLNGSSKEAIIEPLYLNLVPEIRSTLCLIDSMGKPLLVKTVDNYELPLGNRSLVRFMNVSPNALSVSLQIKSDTFRIERLNFLNYSTFKEVDSGQKTIYFVNDFTNAVIDSISNIELRPRHAYNFFLVNKNGFPIGKYEILDQ